MNFLIMTEYQCIKCGKKITYEEIKERSIIVRNFSCIYCDSKILIKSKRPAAKIIKAD
jgi:DNA-directed RNA polymerase subunit RPC12/RpoP